MKPLSRESRALLEAAQGREEPSVSDKDRIRAKLSGRIGAGVAVGSAVTASAAVAEAAKSSALATVAAWLPVTGKVLSVVAIAGGVTVGALSVARHVKRPVASAPMASASMAQPVVGVRAATHSLRGDSAENGVDLPEHPAPSSSPSQPTLANSSPEVGSRRESASPGVASGHSVSAPAADTVVTVERIAQTEDTLASQVAAIREARAAIRRRDGVGALQVLNRAFGVDQGGPLAQEALLARVSALCLVGDSGAARRVADQFLASFPASPLAAGIRASCAFPSNEPIRP